jgi:hypothetical protein
MEQDIQNGKRCGRNVNKPTGDRNLLLCLFPLLTIRCWKSMGGRGGSVLVPVFGENILPAFSGMKWFVSKSGDITNYRDQIMVTE